MDYRAIDHRILKVWREWAPPRAQVLVALSGGVDSLFLADFLRRWQKLLKIEITLAHVHHGQGIDYRNEAFRLVHKWARDHRLNLKSNANLTDDVVNLELAPQVALRSEAALRDWRRQWINKWIAELEADSEAPVLLVTGHTRDDLLETRLLRLLRGTGAQGLKAMSYRTARVLRPLLGESKDALRMAAQELRLRWCEDPSNNQTEYLRNWLRKFWLGPLKQDHPNLVASLARSLETVSEGDATLFVREKFEFSENRMNRRTLQILPRPEQRRMLASYLRSNGLLDYTQGHVEEILKRLDIGRNEHKFSLLGRVFIISSDWIKLSQR